MEPGDDIIDVLYRYQDPEYSSRIRPQPNFNNFNTYGELTDVQNQVNGVTQPQPIRSCGRESRKPNSESYSPIYSGFSAPSSAPTHSNWTRKGGLNQNFYSNFTNSNVNRLDLYSGTGRVGYNNTPQPDRKASFSRGLSQPDFYANRESPLPRSASAFENRPYYKSKPDSPFESRLQKPKLGSPFDRTRPIEDLSDNSKRKEIDPYSLQHESLYIEEEPIYVPRSVMADIIYKNEDDLIRRRHRPEDLIELSSGARQRKSRGFSESLEFKEEKGLEKSRNGEPSGMEGPRQRKGRKEEKLIKNDENRKVEKNAQKQIGFVGLVDPFNKILGTLIMLLLGYKYSYVLLQVHENDLWFSEIMELEREISFRTEQGLYYSYFKQLVSAPSIGEGLRDLQVDNKTESLNTVNIIQRFNVHQEIFLSILYRLQSFGFRPILFYTYFVFALQGLYLSALYLISWSLSGSWLSGVLTVIYIFMNRFDVTRVTFTVPLREHFSLPFIFCQFYATGEFLREGKGSQLLRIYLSGVVYTLTWQFAQFVSLLQALILFILATLGLIDRDKVCKLLGVMFVSILTVWYLQFYQPMVIISLVMSFIPVAVGSLQNFSAEVGIIKNIGSVLFKSFSTLGLSFGLNSFLKYLLNQSADNHIFKFLKNKITRDLGDFETQLYLCNEGFQWLDYNTYARLFSSSVLIIWTIYCAMCVLNYIKFVTTRWMNDPNQKKDGCPPSSNQTKPPRGDNGGSADSTESFSPGVERQDLCFHIGQSLILGLLAVSTLRMKCFWSPYLCILTSAGISDPTLWTFFLNKVSGGQRGYLMNSVRHLVLITLILYLGNQQTTRMNDELENLREFYDPDTVDLMQWIQQNTGQDDAISGSMQLMAGVKLCTGRTITNHPHFEDKGLRDRTQELYQMYGKESPHYVHQLLVKYNTSYIILEDSICLSHRGRCSTPDIMDLVNNHIPEDGIQEPPYLEESVYPRFCDEVRYDSPEYRKLFKPVFENKTFRIYKLHR